MGSPTSIRRHAPVVPEVITNPSTEVVAVIISIIRVVHNKVVLKTDAPWVKDRVINKAPGSRAVVVIAFSLNVLVSRAVVTGREADMDAMTAFHHAMTIKKLTRSRYKIKYAK